MNLTKGFNITNLQDFNGNNLTNIQIGFNYSCLNNKDLDIDLCVAGLNNTDKLYGNDWFIFYNNLKSPNDEIIHLGECKCEGDYDTMIIKLNSIPQQIEKLLLILSIHNSNGNDFSDVEKIRLSIIDKNTNTITHKLNVQRDDLGTLECLVLAEIIQQDNNEWGIKPVCMPIPSLTTNISAFRD